MMRGVPEAGPVVLGILYPAAWFGPGFDAAVAAIESIDPRIEVVVEAYDEGQELRTQRGTAVGARAARGSAPALTDAQRAALARVHAVVAIDLPFDVGQHAPELGWVQAVGAGTGQLASAGLADAGIRLTNAAGTGAVAIAEFVVARILQERKRLRFLDEEQRRRGWRPGFGAELAGSTVGLVGFGAINQAVAARLAAFDVELVACRRSAPIDGPGSLAHTYRPEELHAMLARCDTVVAAVPETPDTIDLFDADAFAAMAPGGFFVNVGRGSLVDEAALVASLTSGHLRGAALDVTRVEPLPEGDPLWSAPNLYLSPHCATVPSALFVNLHRLWADNIERWLAGDPLRNEVDLG